MNDFTAGRKLTVSPFIPHGRGLNVQVDAIGLIGSQYAILQLQIVRSDFVFSHLLKPLFSMWVTFVPKAAHIL